MIKNLRENVDTLMQEAEDTKTRRREEYKVSYVLYNTAAIYVYTSSTLYIVIIIQR